jgi:Transglutaminase-like superfamily
VTNMEPVPTELSKHRISSSRGKLGDLWKALWLLISFDCIALVARFNGVYRWVNSSPIGKPSLYRPPVVDEICAVVNLACSYYPKTAACLQRSAVAARMLLRRGVPAHVVIGIQQFPFASHAWVEVHGVVVNDKPKVKEVYLEIDRFGWPTASKEETKRGNPSIS